MNKRIICVFFIFLFLFGLCSCKPHGDTTKLSFSESVDESTIKSLSGKTVTITGYMATLSPVNGKFMYLMNLPYQSCPFCLPKSNTLTNTMAVYAPSGSKFNYTDQAITVTGTLEVGSFTDDYGYDYTFRIIDATYKIVDLKSAENERLALWYSIAGDGLVSDINTMFDYVYFVSTWYDYYVTDENGNIAYYLYPSDFSHYLEDTGLYGYATQYSDSYFPSLIARAKAIDENGLADLIDIINQAKQLEQNALTEFNNENYTYEAATDIGGEEMHFKLDKKDDLKQEFERIYALYQAWIASWEV